MPDEKIEALADYAESPLYTAAERAALRYADAMRFVNSPEGRRLRLRGLNARVVRPGVVRAGDAVRKLRPELD